MLRRIHLIDNSKYIDQPLSKKVATTENLFYSLMIDGIGLAFFVTPFGELIDIPWAIVSGLLVAKMYGSFRWGALNLIEEILPFTDFVPSATITWLYYRSRQK